MKSKAFMAAIVFVLFLFSFPACSLRSGSSTNVEISTANVNTNGNAESAATPNAGSAQSVIALPETLVADLYKVHDAQKSPFFQSKDRALVDKYFAKPLADLIWKDATTHTSDVGAIDGDPLYNAQDTEIKNFAVGKGEVKGDKANVPVTFTNFGKKQTINYSLITVNGAWKIENISYGEGESLMKWLKDTYSPKPDKDAASSGNFEGRYQVGETSCTVKPVKMAYEIRWAKGSGSEMFFFKDGTTFESKARDGKTNSFVFDDESYDSGTFYRADGTTFVVRRGK